MAGAEEVAGGDSVNTVLVQEIVKLNIVAIIGARSGSKSVKDKNIRQIAGHPLLVYSIRAAHKAGIGRVYVSTDCEFYADMARAHGAGVIMRPDELAQDDSLDSGYILHALSQIKDVPDFVVHLRPTTPFRDPRFITQAVADMAASVEATALRSVEIMSESAFKAMTIENGFLKSIGLSGFALDYANKPRQGYTTTLQANGYVDVLRADFIRRNTGFLHGARVLALITPPTIEIDTPFDLEMAQLYALAHPEIVKRLMG